jgi:ABC-type uncharacterized transport system permease subunit
MRGWDVRSLVVGSIVLVAAGAVLIWGVNASVGGVDVTTIGGGLILIGLIVALVALMVWARRDSFAGQRRGDHTALRR